MTASTRAFIAAIDYKATDWLKVGLRGFNLTDAVYAHSSPYVTQVVLGQPRRLELALHARW